VCADYSSQPTADIAVVQAQCELCNDKKLAAKRVSELSSELFFSIFVRVTAVQLISVLYTSQIIQHHAACERVVIILLEFEA